MIINRKSTFFLGIFIFLIPFLGLPSFWKTLFVTLSGVTLVLMSVNISVARRVSRINKIKKEKVTPVFVENVPIKIESIMPSVAEPEIKKETSTKQKPKNRTRIKKASVLVGIEK